MDAQQQSDSPPEDRDLAPSGPEPERQRPDSEGHAGQGADSAMKQMRVWEQRRANQSGGKGRQGPH
jgi:hypothetical protein